MGGELAIRISLGTYPYIKIERRLKPVVTDSPPLQRERQPYPLREDSKTTAKEAD